MMQKELHTTVGWGLTPAVHSTAGGMHMDRRSILCCVSCPRPTVLKEYGHFPIKSKMFNLHLFSMYNFAERVTLHVIIQKAKAKYDYKANFRKLSIKLRRLPQQSADWFAMTPFLTR